jgi:hypothetical protein
MSKPKSQTANPVQHRLLIGGIEVRCSCRAWHCEDGCEYQEIRRRYLDHLHAVIDKCPLDGFTVPAADIPARKTKRKPKQDRACLYCGGAFVTNRETAVYCSAKCRWAHWERKHPRMNREPAA